MGFSFVRINNIMRMADDVAFSNTTRVRVVTEIIYPVNIFSGKSGEFIFNALHNDELRMTT